MKWGGTEAGYTDQPLTGSAKTQATGAQNVPLRSRPQNAGGVTRTFLVKLAASAVAQPAPGFIVPDGCTVRIRANNGTLTNNAAMIAVADNPAAFTTGHGTPLAPLDDIAWPARNLANIWVQGTAGDGVVISVLDLGFGNS